MRQVFPKLSDVLLAVDGALVVMYRGSWVLGTDYVAGDLVIDNGSWFCIANNIGSATNEPGVGANQADYWVPLQHVTASAAQHFTATDTTPYARLVAGGGAYSLEMRLESGKLKFYDNIAARSLMELDSAGGLAVTDGKTKLLPLPFTQGVYTVAATGVLTTGMTISEGATDNVQKIVRSASVTETYYRVDIPLPKRSTANKGSKLKSVQMSYVVSGGATGDIIQLQILKQTIPVDGNASVGSILAGDDDADYDASHNTDLLRWAAGNHTITVTIPTGEQAYALAGERFAARVRVKDLATASLAMTITGMEAEYVHSEY